MSECSTNWTSRSSDVVLSCAVILLKPSQNINYSAGVATEHTFIQAEIQILAEVLIELLE